MIRLPLALIMAAVVTFGLFWGMQALIANETTEIASMEKMTAVDFVRIKRDEHTQTKQRSIEKPPKPKTKEPPKPPTTVNKNPTVKPQTIAMPKIDLPHQFLSAPSLAGIPMSTPRLSGPVDAGSDIIPLVTVPPQYPRRARMRRMEGYVTLAFIITKEGMVRNVSVVDSKPDGVFDKEAANAISRWKFKPRREAGELVEQRAVQTLEFKLR